MEPGSESPRNRKIIVTRLLHQMRLETAVHFLRAGRGELDPGAVAAMICVLAFRVMLTFSVHLSSFYFQSGEPPNTQMSGAPFGASA